MKQKISVAVADDHPALVKGLRFILEAYKDYKVSIEAYNGAELIEKIEQASALPDVCLLDISMPVMNGFEALTIIKQRWKSIKVIMQSTYYNEFNILKAFREGASAYLPKDADPKEIKSAIDTVCDDGFHYSEWEKEHVLPHIQDKTILTTINDKEIEFLKHICSDMTYEDIAAVIGKSARTVEGYRDALFQKLKLKNRTELALFAIRSGLVIIH